VHLADKSALMNALRQVIDSAGGMEQAAAVLEVKYSTLLNRLSPANEDHRLGFFDAVMLMDRAPDRLPVLHWLAERFGLLVIAPPKGQASRSALLRLNALLVSEEGRVSADLAGATDAEGHPASALTEDQVHEMEAHLNEIERSVETIKIAIREHHEKRRQRASGRG
jgi:hypothetical protein